VYAGLFRKKYNWLFENIEKYLTPEDFDRYRFLGEGRYGKGHQEVYGFYLLKGIFPVRYIGQYLGRSKSAVDRSNKVLEQIGLIVLEHGKYNFITGKKTRNKLLEGADGLKNYREKEQEKVREKRTDFLEKYGNSIDRLVDKAVRKNGGTKIPTGSEIYISNNMQSVDDFPNFHLDLFQHFTPVEPEPLPSPKECKRWGVYNALGKVYPKFQTNPKTWPSQNKKPSGTQRKGFQKRFAKDGCSVWMNIKTGDLEYTQRENLVRVKKCLGKKLHYEDGVFQYFLCYHRGEFDPSTIVTETLKIRKRFNKAA
jgi:predicted transcriptional regulator